MNLLTIVLAVLLGLLLGAWAGHALGGLVRGRPRRYWALNIAALAVCMVADFVGLVLGWAPLAYGALGAMGGSLTGLKYGYSESIGLWRIIDRFAGIESPHPADEPANSHDPADPSAE